MANDTPEEQPAHEEFELQFSDYLEGTLAAKERAELEAHLASCPACRAAHAEFEQTMQALGKIGKGVRPPAPEAFGKNVEEILEARSGGRFFGKKSLGDRLPFGIMVVVALIVLVAVSIALWSSSTGSIRRPPRTDPPKVAPGADEAMPRP